MGLIFAGCPVGFSMFITAFFGLAIWVGWGQAFALLSFDGLYGTPPSFMLLVVPLFILIAQIIAKSRATDILYEAFWEFFSGVRGGLSLATVGMATILGACIGASIASVAAMAQLGLEQMLRRGYKKWLAAGSIVGTGGLAIIIPPSIPAIMYAFVVELPILDMFAACLIPGLLLAAGYAGTILIYTYLKPDIAPAGESLSIKVRMNALVKMLPFMGLIALVLGSIFSGLCAITESAAFGCLGAFLIAKFKGAKEIKMHQYLFNAGRDTAITTCYLMVIIVGAKYFGQFWTYTGVIETVSRMISGTGLSPMVVLLCMNILVLFLGRLMDSAGIILVVLPILVAGLKPLGFDPVHIGVVFLINLEMGLTTPPVGMNLFVFEAIAKPFGVTYIDTLKGAVPFLIVDAVVLLIVAFVPELALWLPRQLH
ncbi:MAG: TRAP transporter large permease [Deltaproteobacteria bacterium]|nr:TRAP transporter large permease [Deltaproteobacteria bacterium]